MARNRRTSNVKNIKDYLVPIITFLLIFVLIYVAFSSGDTKQPSQSNNETTLVGGANSVAINLSSDSDEVFVLNEDDKKIKVQSGDSVSPGESLMVNKGSASFSIPSIAQLNLDKNGEVNYKKDSKFGLESSSLWVNASQDLELDLRYVNVKVGKDSVVNLNQNEVESSVYLLTGTAEVTNLSGVSTLLSQGQKISVSSKDASNDELDMVILKQEFDDYFKISDWFIQNNNTSSIEDDNETSDNGSSDELDFDSLASTGSSIKRTSLAASASSLITFDNIFDEGSVATSSTNISGKFQEEFITAITIGGKNAVINKENKTFNAIGVNTSNKTNDIVVKIFDEGNNVLGKYVYTIYNNGGAVEATSTFSKINTSSYPVNASDFIISTPTVKGGETYLDENTFYGTVKNPDVASVLVNGFKLSTYNGSTFRYHAYKRFKTLGEGVNNYEIKYVGKDGKVILKKYITINKKSKAPVVVEKKEEITEEVIPEVKEEEQEESITGTGVAE